MKLVTIYQGENQGGGEMILRKGARYYHHSLSQCDWSRPTGHFDLYDYGHISLTELVRTCTPELAVRLEPLVRAATTEDSTNNNDDPPPIQQVDEGEEI